MGCVVNNVSEGKWKEVDVPYFRNYPFMTWREGAKQQASEDKTVVLPENRRWTHQKTMQKHYPFSRLLYTVFLFTYINTRIHTHTHIYKPTGISGPAQMKPRTGGGPWTIC
jgi:hypothetical protein